MTGLGLRQYQFREYPQENARCEWKEFKNLKTCFCGDDGILENFSAKIAAVSQKMCNFVSSNEYDEVTRGKKTV